MTSPLVPIRIKTCGSNLIDAAEHHPFLGILTGYRDPVLRGFADQTTTTTATPPTTHHPPLHHTSLPTRTLPEHHSTSLPYLHTPLFRAKYRPPPHFARSESTK